MRCSKCGSDTKVLETRANEDGLPKRRRECLSCGYRFNTLEIEENPKPRQEKPSEPKVKKPKAVRPIKASTNRPQTRRQEDVEVFDDYISDDDLGEIGIDIGRGPGYF